MSLGYAAAGKPALLDLGSVASEVGWPRAHLVFADATIAFAPVRRQPLDEPGAGLLRRDHRLHAEGAGKCVGRGVAAQFGLQAVEVLGMLRDPARTQVMLVTLAEETPINELIETAYRLEDQLQVSLGPVIVNGVLPELADIDRDPAELIGASAVPPSQMSTLRAAGHWWSTRFDRQREELDRLAEALPLPQIQLPYLFGHTIGAAESVALSDALIRGVSQLDG